MVSSDDANMPEAGATTLAEGREQVDAAGQAGTAASPDTASGAAPDTVARAMFSDNRLLAAMVGEHDENLRHLQDAFPKSRIHLRGNELSVDGDEAETVLRLFEELLVLAERGQGIDGRVLDRTIDMVRCNVRPSEVLTHDVLCTVRGRVVRPKSSGQKRYVDAIGQNVITFGIGPAGTGKSWLAVAMAVRALHSDEVDRIILTRPAVEAGERLGFLPGDLMAKVDPYLRPLYDALCDMVGSERMESLLEHGTVEVAPLAFMRGRTLNSSFIILDEAQNTTPEQMKMFLTRMGFNSKAVVTGDVTQMDLTGGRSGLVGIEDLLSEIDGIGFVYLSKEDVVRHRIVVDIVAAYDRSGTGARSGGSSVTAQNSGLPEAALLSATANSS